LPADFLIALYPLLTEAWARHDLVVFHAFVFLAIIAGADDHLVEDFEDRSWVLLRQAGRERRATMAVVFLDLIILFRDGAMPLNWSIVVGPLVFLSFIFLFFAPTYAGDY
jgi:hypothetical protein